MEIGIIKLGAEGDILRTLPVVKAIKDKYPNSKITFITRKGIVELINNLSYINKIDIVPYTNTQTFDKLYNFDMDAEAVDLAKSIKSKEKYGFTDKEGFPATFNLNAEYYLNTTFDDELKKNNKKTYQEMMFEVAEIPYKKTSYELILREDEKKYADAFIKEHNLKGKKIIGIHMGASSRWPSKVWHFDRVKKFITLAKDNGYEVLLFGGPNEIDTHKEFLISLEKTGLKVHQNNPHNSKREFAALVEKCDSIVCSDSFALHVSLGLGKKTIGLFFCTSPSEVEDYGLLKKVISPMLHKFFPEKSDQYSEELVKSITEDEVLSAVKGKA